jgi:hypothetical protein
MLRPVQQNFSTAGGQTQLPAFFLVRAQTRSSPHDPLIFRLALRMAPFDPGFAIFECLHSSDPKTLVLQEIAVVKMWFAVEVR